MKNLIETTIVLAVGVTLNLFFKDLGFYFAIGYLLRGTQNR